MKHDIERLRRLVPAVADKIAAATVEAGQFSHADYAAWRQRRDAADAALMKFFVDAEGAVFSERPPHDHTVKMAGIRSTSTSGFHVALCNWRRSALARIGAATEAEVSDDPINLQGSGPALAPREG